MPRKKKTEIAPVVKDKAEVMTEAVKETIEFYIKPEDKAVYYVINGDFSDKIEL
ncbi:DUF6465 family protein [Ruminococcus sp.]|uniref:DUF6465 family protein n=1 Tax=Ruminococcus sp. TaxID=41978 RepID=UPI00258F9FF9|nr:DUF6465 family protein [Ruminococcus sp.]MCR5021803.1 DUF6465 family protein [Ruminococcus sp.]